MTSTHSTSGTATGSSLRGELPGKRACQACHQHLGHEAKTPASVPARINQRALQGSVGGGYHGFHSTLQSACVQLQTIAFKVLQAANHIAGFFDTAHRTRHRISDPIGGTVLAQGLCGDRLNFSQ